MNPLFLCLFAATCAFWMLSDPYRKDQWYLDEAGVPELWGESRGAGVKVALIDAGAALNHPDLPPFTAVSVVGNAITPIGIHGTLALGVVAAVAGNGIGIAGIAPRAEFLVIRATNLADGSAYVSDIAKAIRLAADEGADVVCASYAVNKRYTTINEAAHYLRSKGGLLLVPAGNTGTDGGYPDHTDILAVGAVDREGAIPDWSSHGDWVDLYAPGVGIWTTNILGRYGSFSGTSMSIMVACGVAALLAGAHPEATPEQIELMLGAD